MNADIGDLEEAQEVESVTAEESNQWEELANKYEDLAQTVHEYIDDEDNAEARNPSIVKFPPSMTKDEWERHQVTHTPYAPGCRHCAAARAFRRQHPKRRKHNVIIPDVDGSEEGPTKISMDYMYLSERSKEDRDTATNPPHLVIVDHRLDYL